jgi:hypothetical protein
MSKCRTPQGKFARCSPGRRNANPDDPIFPPGLDWDRVGRKFSAAHAKWYEGLREYSDVMAEIEGYSALGGPKYREVLKIAKRGQKTAAMLMKQKNAIKDDLYRINQEMPRRG